MDPREAKCIEETSESRQGDVPLVRLLIHELAAPTEAIRLTVRGLLAKTGRGDDEAFLRRLDALGRNSERLVSILRGARQACQFEAGDFAITREAVDVRTIVRDVEQALDPLVSDRAIDLSVSTPERPVFAYADPLLLDQVVTNLVHNAIKFTKADGQVRVVVRQETGGAFIDVHDTGLGMTTEQVAQLFQPFARLHDDVPGGPGGTGLGLHIANRIVERHGGTLRCESAGPGRGTSFYLFMPDVIE